MYLVLRSDRNQYVPKVCNYSFKYSNYVCILLRTAGNSQLNSSDSMFLRKTLVPLCTGTPGSQTQNCFESTKS